MGLVQVDLVLFGSNIGQKKTNTIEKIHETAKIELTNGVLVLIQDKYKSIHTSTIKTPINRENEFILTSENVRQQLNDLNEKKERKQRCINKKT